MVERMSIQQNSYIICLLAFSAVTIAGMEEVPFSLSKKTESDEPVTPPSSPLLQERVEKLSLLSAVLSGDYPALVALLNQGLDSHINNLNIPDAMGVFPLHYAVERNYIDIARALLIHGADPNRADPLGRTPLHYAVLAGMLEFVQLLLVYKASPLRPDNLGDTPLNLIKHKRKSPYTEIQAALMGYKSLS
jgi:ankyrin repeat protein